ncbi:hypothetical protein LTR84_006893 [Exophiala bonariae]|uniref:TauD/TfdA-like domain-containing protein n=1 Tax=Exophiala bonariae TaxID=1690606 RepID=A0AAV9N3J9_9EURO|nr:hypothetical protein LTR84_006893 [Exophiala bonariae]
MRYSTSLRWRCSSLSIAPLLHRYPLLQPYRRHISSGPRYLAPTAENSLSPTQRQTEQISPILVRDACRCSQCVDPSDRQRNYSYSEIPTNIEVQSTTSHSDNATTTIQWNNDTSASHKTTLATEHIKRLQEPFRNANWEFYKRPRKLWNNETYRTEKNPRINYDEYMSKTDVLARSLHLLWRDGLVFIDQVPESEESVRTIVERMGPLQNTFYGPTWNVRSLPQAKNVAYTSKYLGFHMDLLYMRDPPGLQFLHCIHNSCTGGESRFADTFKAVDELYSQADGPEMVQTLLTHQVRYEYDNDNFFYSDAKPTIQASPATHTPRDKVLLAKNPELMRRIEHVFWSPPFVGNIDTSQPHGELVKFIRASKAFSDILEDAQNVVEVKMDSGTCVVFDNQRIVHARNEFDANSGKRFLKGAYLAHQDFESKAVGLQHLMPEGEGI